MSINGIQNTSFPLTLSGLTLTDDLSGTYIPYAGANNSIDLNNKTVSNVASLAVVGTVSGASVTASGAISGNSLAITNHTTSNSLTVGTLTFVVSKIFSYVFSSTFIVYVTNMPSYWVAGDQIQVTGITSFPAFNRVYTINSFIAGGFYTTFVSLGQPNYYESSSGSCYRASGVVGQVFSDSVYTVNNTNANTLTVRTSASITNLTASGTNAISNLTTTGTLTTNGLTLAGTTFAEFGFGTVGKQANAGKIAYELFEAGYLGIVGAGTTIGTRNVKIYDNAFTGTLTVSGTTQLAGTSTALTPATTDNNTNIATTAFVNNFAIPISGICTGVNNTLRLFNALSTAVFRITSPSGTNIFQVYYTSGVPEVICSSLQVATSGEFRALGSCNLGATTCTTLTASGAVGITGALTQTGGAQTFALGAYGSPGDYIVPPTNFYGSTVSDGFNGVNIQCQASQYGRNILFLTGRYEGGNDAWSWNAPRNAIIFRTQASLNSSATIRFTIQNFFQELGIMSAGKASVPITKWANDGTMTHTDNMSIGGVLTLTKTGDGVLQLANTASIQVKNSAGTYEQFIWGRWSDNVTYLNYGSAGFNIRNNASTNVMFLNNAGNVGIGNTSPICSLDVKGIANIWSGARSAVVGNFMSAGSLTIGDVTANFGGGGTGWNSSTAGLMLECLDNTEIAVHNAGTSVNSIVQYIGGLQRLRFGRDMGAGWGETPSLFDGTIYCVANTALSSRSTYGQLVVSNGFNNNSIIHRHDGGNYYMLISNGVYDTVWNGLRPFRIEIATGLLVSDNKQFFRGGCNVERNTPSGSHGDAALYVTADTGASLIECRHSNGSQGVGISYNSIYATGYNTDQDLNISARGNGALKLNQATVTLPNITGQTSFTANILQIGNSSQICYAQFQTIRCNTRGNWGGGVSIGEFDKGSTNSAVTISGGASYYVSSGGNTEIVVRLYNSRTGGYYYYNYLQYTNVTYNHTQFPISNFAPNNTLPYGYYYIFVYLQTGNWITDGNDYCCFNVTIHP